MSRIERADGPDTRHHIMNRGIARRTLFESRKDMRFFLSLIAREVRKKRIVLLGFCLMSTHYHLFVVSVSGQLDQAMHHIQLGYSRYFNRSRHRDGPLVRGRFMSKLVDSDEYSQILGPYIEYNPVQAGMVERPSDYEFCSAFYRRPGKPPRWFPNPFSMSDDIHLSAGDYNALSFVVESHLRKPRKNECDDLLLHSSPERVLDWMTRKAELADGTKPGLPICDPRSILIAIGRSESSIQRLTEQCPVRAGMMLKHMSSGLLRDFCGLSFVEIGNKTQRSETASTKSYKRYRFLMESNPELVGLVSQIGSMALENSPLRLFNRRL
ncbi:MAG: REP element-mobilizing transposase RayT [Planctomycetota bacterium]|jgi:REP element-mobilizing transposase RayT